MSRPGLMSPSDPPDPPLADSTAAATSQVENDPRLAFWSGFDTSPAPVQNNANLFAPPSRNTQTRPALSFGFSMPQAASPNTVQAGLNVSNSTAGSSPFGASSFGVSSFGTSSFGGKPSSRPSALGLPSSLGLENFAPSSLPLSLRPVSQAVQPNVLPGNDALSRALLRASQNRPAVFGRKDIDADELISDFRSSSNGLPHVKDLVADLVAVSQTHPIAMGFLQHIFKKAARDDRGEPSPPPPSRYLKQQIVTQKHLDYEVHDIFHDQEGWKEDLCGYIVRMIVFGLTPREIRAAVKAEMDCTHGHNHVSNKEVEGLVTWMRGPGADLVRDVKFTGSALDFFRPSMRKTRSFAKEVPRTNESDCHCAGEDLERRTLKKQSSEGEKFDGLFEKADEEGKGEVQDEMKFRFMDLPAELRLWVYESALTPTGHISLRSCAHHMPAGVHPQIATPLFCASKVVRKEAEGLLMENTIIVNGCLEFGSRPAIHRSQLPDHILPLVKSLVIVVDFTKIVQTARVADWRVAQGLTGLKKLRICGIATKDPGNHLSEWLATHLHIILERVPADCSISFGQESGGTEVEAHVLDMVEKIKAGGPHVMASTPVIDTYAVEGAMLESAWMAIESDVVRGCKSGFKEDFRFEDRRAKGELDQHFLDLRRRQEEAMQWED